MGGGEEEGWRKTRKERRKEKESPELPGTVLSKWPEDVITKLRRCDLFSTGEGKMG